MINWNRRELDRHITGERVHDCWSCGQACDCDSEDIWLDDFEECEHECEEQE